ncbi:MAG: hypothetical protein KC561_04760, partial [Myxococcales bacterium]|nr:hypothetical protein [Myxococcales bacterium]
MSEDSASLRTDASPPSIADRSVDCSVTVPFQNEWIRFGLPLLQTIVIVYGLALWVGIGAPTWLSVSLSALGFLFAGVTLVFLVLGGLARTDAVAKGILLTLAATALSFVGMTFGPRWLAIGTAWVGAFLISMPVAALSQRYYERLSRRARTLRVRSDEVSLSGGLVRRRIPLSDPHEAYVGQTETQSWVTLRSRLRSLSVTIDHAGNDDIPFAPFPDHVVRSLGSPTDGAHLSSDSSEHVQFFASLLQVLWVHRQSNLICMVY